MARPIKPGATFPFQKPQLRATSLCPVQGQNIDRQEAIQAAIGASRSTQVEKNDCGNKETAHQTSIKAALSAAIDLHSTVPTL
jgi:hypothetical protein